MKLKVSNYVKKEYIFSVKLFFDKVLLNDLSMIYKKYISILEKPRIKQTYLFEVKNYISKPKPLTIPIEYIKIRDKILDIKQTLNKSFFKEEYSDIKIPYCLDKEYFLASNIYVHSISQSLFSYKEKYDKNKEVFLVEKGI